MSSADYLVFSVSGTRCAILASQVLHISPVVGMERIDEAKPPIIGICYYAGRAVIGLDLPALLRFKSSVYGPEARLVIVDGNEYLYGLNVDRIEDLYTIDIDQCRTMGRHSEFFRAPCIREVFLRGDQVICLLESESLVQPMHRELLRRSLERPIPFSMDDPA